MKLIYSSRDYKFFLYLILISLLISCGVKAPPVVPHSPIPRTINNLGAFPREGKVLLQWSVPQKDTEGKKLSNLGGFRIWRKFIPIEKKGCSTCPNNFKVLFEIDCQLPQNDCLRQKKMIYWDYQVEKEGKYAYRVTSYTTAGIESRPSNIAEINWVTPFPPPIGLKAKSGDGMVSISWELPPSLLENNEYQNRLSGFNIYRRYPNQDYGITPLNKNPILKNSFQDLEVTNGKKYYYIVRTLKNSGSEAIESKNSVEVEAIPEDLTPPSPPSVIMAFQTHDGIVIIWEPNLDSDLEGYYIYRRRDIEDKPIRVSPLIKGKTMYLDQTFSPGLTYYYSVTAVDRSPRHNESDFSQEMKVITITSKEE